MDIFGIFSGKGKTGGDTDGLTNPKSNDDIVAGVKDYFEEKKKLRWHEELQWMLNMNFRDGNQYCDINFHTLSIEDMAKLQEGEEREVFNRIAPIIDIRLAKLNRVNPMLNVRPNSSEQRDISTAKVCSRIAQGIYYDQRMKAKIEECNAWCEITGNAFRKQVWDINSGLVLGTDDTGAVIKDGKVLEVVVPTFEIYPDNIFEPNIRKQRRLIHAKAYHVDDIYDIWGIKIPGKDVEAYQMERSKYGIGGFGHASAQFRMVPTKLKDHEIVIELSELPSKMYPDGRLIIVIGDQLVYYDKLPYLCGDDNTPGHPFSHQKCLVKEGYFWGKTVIERLLPVQRRYNAVKNRKAEYLNRVAIGNLTYEEGSLTDETEERIYNDGIVPGDPIVIKKGTQKEPKWLDNTQLPNAFDKELQDLENDFIRISGISELSRDSTAPPGVKSGRALQVIEAQDDTRISLTGENIINSVIESGKNWLRISKQYAKGPRILRYVAKEDMVDVIEWQASDITTDDIICDNQNAMFESTEQRRQLVFSLLQSGLFNDPDTGTLSKYSRTKVFEMIGMGNWEDANDLTDLQIQKQKRENLMMRQGAVAPIAQFDDDALHMQIIDKFRLTTEFEELLSQNPIIAKVFEFHYQQHSASLSYKMAQRAMMAPQDDSRVG
jgi:hypothetical protein